MIRAVIFDLDGVLVTTDECHYQAWKKMADEQNIPFSREINEQLRGVSRMDCVDIILKNAARAYTDAEKLALATRKNDLYIALISQLNAGAILPGALDTVRALRNAGIKVAVGSASKNTPLILHQLQMDGLFDAVSDGNQLLHGKPDPEVFLRAAKMVSIPPADCLVVEDADAGLEAAKRGGMRSLGVGAAQNNDKATFNASSLADIDLAALIRADAI